MCQTKEADALLDSIAKTVKMLLACKEPIQSFTLLESSRHHHCNLMTEHLLSEIGSVLELLCNASENQDDWKSEVYNLCTAIENCADTLAFSNREWTPYLTDLEELP